MKNKFKGEILLCVSIILYLSLMTLKVNRFLTSFFPMEGWVLLLLIGVGLGFIMSNGDS